MFLEFAGQYHTILRLIESEPGGREASQLGELGFLQGRLEDRIRLLAVGVYLLRSDYRECREKPPHWFPLVSG